MSEKQRQAQENLEWYGQQLFKAECEQSVATMKIRELHKQIDYWRKALWSFASNEPVGAERPAEPAGGGEG